MEQTENQQIFQTNDVNYKSSIVYSLLFSFNWLAFGYALAYGSDSQFVYTKANIMSDVQAGVYGSMLAVGALIGGIVTGLYLINRIGYKNCMLVSLGNTTLGWFIHMLVMLIKQDNIQYAYYLLIVARLLIGCGNGISSICVPPCVSAIAPSNVRHLVGPMPPFCMNFGFLLSYIAGWGFIVLDDKIHPISSSGTPIPTCKNFTYSLLYAPAVGIGLSLIGLIVTLIVPLPSKRPAEDDYDSLDPLLAPQTTWLTKLRNKLSIFFQPKVKKQLVIGVGMMIFQQILGINAIVFNATYIFSSNFPDSSDISIGALCGICVGVAIFASTFGTLVLSWFLMRNICIYVCSSALLLIDILLGVYFYMKWNFPILASVLITLYVFIFFCSWSSLSWLIISEIYCPEFKSIGTAISTSVMWILTVILSASYIPLAQAVSNAGVFFIFAGTTLLSIPFIYFFVPETKFKSLEEVQRLFE